MLIKPKGSPFYIFRTMRNFLKDKKSKISVFLKSLVPFLSLRYSADFRRSRLVTLFTLYARFLVGLVNCRPVHAPIRIYNLETVYVNRKTEFVTVNQNSLNYGGGKIVFHRSVVNACFVFRNLFAQF